MEKANNGYRTKVQKGFLVTIPKEYRDSLGWKPGTKIRFVVRKDAIILKHDID